MITLLTGDVREVLPTLPDASVQCVVTSPPYYGLRDYGTAQWEGGDAGCGHIAPQGGPSTKQESSAGTRQIQYRDTCGKCGARRIDAQIGLEPTPEAFIAELVAVFREVRRVLRNDGTCWVNLGDSYAASQYGSGGGWAKEPAVDGIMRNNRSLMAEPFRVKHGAKPKDLLMMPARVALALQADGWWLRSDIIWAKPNPMPESCRDRPTRSHEYVFLLTKAARYYYDQQGIAEPLDRPEEADRRTPAKFGGANKFAEAFKQSRLHSGNEYRGTPTGTRNSRSVWTIATAPFPAAHFATFPPELAERCIRAGTSERGACVACGAPWVRVTEATPEYAAARAEYARIIAEQDTKAGRLATGAISRPYVPGAGTFTTGWTASCQCNADVRPCVVLDPFSGAGTALLVADRLHRDSIGIDLSHAYVEMARERLRADCPLFAEISDAPVPVHPVETEIADLFAEAAE